MKTLIKILAICVFIIMLNACKKTEKENEELSPVENAVIVQKDWEVINEPEYTISYPKNWSVDKSGNDGVELVLNSPSDSDDDSFQQNANFLRESLPDDSIGLEEYAKAAIDQAKTIFPTVLSKERVKSDNKDFYKVIFSGTQSGIEFIHEQQYRVKDKMAYILTFTSTQSDYEKDKVIGNKILKSFRLK